MKAQRADVHHKQPPAYPHAGHASRHTRQGPDGPNSRSSRARCEAAQALHWTKRCPPAALSISIFERSKIKLRKSEVTCIHFESMFDVKIRLALHANCQHTDSERPKMVRFPRAWRGCMRRRQLATAGLPGVPRSSARSSNWAAERAVDASKVLQSTEKRTCGRRTRKHRY